MRGYPNIPNPTGNNTQQVLSAVTDMLGNITGQQQQPIDQLSSSAALTDCVNKINEVIARLQGNTKTTISTLAQSLSSNGYKKLDGGLILQWGSAVTSGGSIAVTFPLAFPTGALFAICDVYLANSNSTTVAQTGSPGLTGVTLYASNGSTGAAAGPTTLCWLALGY